LKAATNGNAQPLVQICKKYNKKITAKIRFIAAVKCLYETKLSFHMGSWIRAQKKKRYKIASHLWLRCSTEI